MTKTDVPAFPAPNYIYDSARIDKDAFQKMGLTQGMTLRDYFAGQALAGMLSRDCDKGGWSGVKGVQKVSKFAYEYADAMLAARKDSDEAKAE